MLLFFFLLRKKDREKNRGKKREKEGRREKAQLNCPSDKPSTLVTVQWVLRLSQDQGINRISG